MTAWNTSRRRDSATQNPGCEERRAQHRCERPVVAGKDAFHSVPLVPLLRENSKAKARWNYCGEVMSRAFSSSVCGLVGAPREVWDRMDRFPRNERPLWETDLLGLGSDRQLSFNLAGDHFALKLLRRHSIDPLEMRGQMALITKTEPHRYIRYARFRT
jgi:hypothetical protein